MLKMIIKQTKEPRFIAKLLKGFCSQISEKDHIIYQQEVKTTPQAAVMQNNLGREIALFYVMSNTQISGVLLYVVFSDYLFMSRIIVNPNRRNSGIGKELFKNFIQEAKNLNKTSVRWKVNKTNKNALSFYGSMGYKSDKTVNGKYGRMFAYEVKL